MVSNPEIRRISWRFVDPPGGDHDDDENHRLTIQRATSTSTVFDDCVRALLGVSGGKVAVEHETSEVNPWGCETWESEETVTVRVGDRTLSFERLSDLFRRLDVVDLTSPGPHSRTYTSQEVMEQWHQVEAEFVFPDGRTWRGRVGNANGWQVLLVGETPAPGAQRWHPDRHGGIDSLVAITSIDLIRPIADPHS